MFRRKTEGQKLAIKAIKKGHSVVFISERDSMTFDYADFGNAYLLVEGSVTFNTNQESDGVWRPPTADASASPQTGESRKPEVESDEV